MLRALERAICGPYVAFRQRSFRVRAPIADCIEIVVDAHDDPKVQGVTCYVSRAKTGGIKGALGLAEDRSEASIDCRQTGPLVVKGKLPQQEEVFTERTSLVFKRLRIVRMLDPQRQTLVYLSYSDRLIEGSPDNSISVVPAPGVPMPKD